MFTGPHASPETTPPAVPDRACVWSRRTSFRAARRPPSAGPSPDRPVLVRLGPDPQIAPDGSRWRFCGWASIGRRSVRNVDLEADGSGREPGGRLTTGPRDTAPAGRRM